MEINNKANQLSKENTILSDKLKKMQSKYAKLLEKYFILSKASDEGLVICYNGAILEANLKFAKLFKLSMKKLMGLDGKTLVIPQLLSKISLNFLNSKTVNSVPAITDFYKSDGSVFNCELKVRIIHPGLKNYIGILIKDITEEKKIRDALLESKEKYKIIVENQTDLVDELDPEGNLTFVSPSYCEFYETTESNLLGKNFLMQVGNEDKNQAKNALNKVKKPPFISTSEQAVNTSKGIKYIHWINKAIFNKEGKISSIIGVGRDITDKKIFEEKIKFISFHDKLTGLYNRAFFEEELKRLDTKRQLPLSIVIGDVNGLKLLNDAFGHDKGDILLKYCADILKKCCRKEDIIARWGGDEFAIILPKTSEDEAINLISRIKKSSCKENRIQIPLSISFGTATKKTMEKTIDDKIKKAEDNMYKQKLFERKSFRSSLISSLERTMLEKSHETEEHCKRIKILALKIGAVLKLSESKLYDLAILSALHDIGKVAVPENILIKKDKLNEKEWKLIKKHPEIGHNIVEASPQLAHIAEYILYHHEWWDGSGYPQGLKGNKIPLLSRIISIADAYDVIIHGRNYRKAKSKTEAIAEIEKYSGIQFDPEITKIFLDLFKKSKIRKPHS